MSRQRSVFLLCLQSARPRQWIKSSFLLAPALFTLRILEPGVWLTLIFGAFGFSLIASAIYTFNDIIHRTEDCLHPVKKDRPLASGRLSLTTGWILSITLLLVGLGIMVLISKSFALFGLAYVLLMVIYTLYLRQLFLVDVIVIATGFVIRVEAGASLIHEPVSNWLLLCTFTIALFLGMIKRREELFALRAAGLPIPRKALAMYPDISIVDGWISVLGGITALAYALYSMDPITIEKHNTDALLYTFPFVIYGIFRYRTLSLSGRAGEDPTEIIAKDPGIKLVVLLWVVIVAVILYLGKTSQG